jgi:hypothetical protein
MKIENKLKIEMLWGRPQLSHTNNERRQNLKNQKPEC